MADLASTAFSVDATATNSALTTSVEMDDVQVDSLSSQSTLTGVQSVALQSGAPYRTTINCAELNIPIMFSSVSDVPSTLGLKFNTRVSDLTARDVMVVVCCGKEYRIAPHQLHAKYREMTPLYTLEKSFKCKACGTTGNMPWYLERAVSDEYLRSFNLLTYSIVYGNVT